MSEEQQFQNYHRVLNRAKWSALKVSRILLGLIVSELVAIKLGLRCARFANPVTYISRLQLNARLFNEPGPQPPGKPGPKHKKGKRQ